MTVEQEPPPFEMTGEAAAAILELADDEFVLGHRHSEWLGLSPFLEEDLAMASIAQDELGHARALYALVWPSWTDRDAMVVRRPPANWRCCALVERECVLWEDALVRHLLYDVAEAYRWRVLVDRFKATVPGLEALAARALSEERYHHRHAVELVTRLGRGTTEANTRLQRSLEALWPDAVAMIDPEVDAMFFDECATVFAAAGLRRPATTGSRGDRRNRSDGFASIRDSLLAVPTIDPSATW